MTREPLWMLCTNSAVRRVARQLGQLYDDVIEPIGLKGTQFSLLSLIAEAGEPTLRQLAESLVMDQSALGHTLKPLIRDGYLELVPDQHDKRAKRARLTAAGKAKQAEGVVLWRDAQSRFDRVFGAAESHALKMALSQIATPEFAASFRGKPPGSPD